MEIKILCKKCKVEFTLIDIDEYDDKEYYYICKSCKEKSNTKTIKITLKDLQGLI
jgi:hypothetical protein